MTVALRIGSLALAGCAAMLLGLFVGGSQLPAASVAWTLLHPHASGDVATIVWQLRAPRVCIAALVGAALAVSGFLLQGMLRNPLVDPFLTGISSGAALATALAIAAGLAIPFVPALGFGAGLLTALAVAFLARRGSGLDAERLILAGISLSALFSAFVALALTRVGRASSSTILAWLAGSIAGRGWNDLFWAAPYAIVGFGLALAVVPALNAMRLGDDVARAVGLDVVRANWMILSAATLLTAAAVALAGTIGFVGLIVPHLARRMLGTDGRKALLASALLGAALVPLADAASRTLWAPAEIPLGVLLAIIGVPTFLYLYLRPASATRMWGT
jgi:iron complex transport system permease protein